MKFVFVFLLGFLGAQAQSLKYLNKHHEFPEVVKDQALVFAGHTTGYLITQWNGIREEGSWKKYEGNFGKFRFDNDNTAWNFAGHTYTGAQVYLYYRSQGYKQNNSLYLSFLSSLWFELFIENYTERPSFQDVFNTPMFGSALGYVIEKKSVDWINSQNKTKRIFGRILNPFSLLVDEESDVSFYPDFGGGGRIGLNMSFAYD